MRKTKIETRVQNAFLNNQTAMTQFKSIMKALDNRINEINTGNTDELLEKELDWCVQAYAVGARTILLGGTKASDFNLMAWKRVTSLDTMQDV